jgi:methanogenic corrinoid protein MtbC1
MDKQLTQKLADLEEKEFLDQVKKEIVAGTDPLVVFNACREGMTIVGQRFEEGTYWVSDLVLSSEMFKQATKIVEPHIKTAEAPVRGKVVLGTVQGDIHDIGKDLVAALLKAANFEVHDLGVDVPPERFVEVLKETNAPVLALSALLTTAFDAIQETVSAVDAAGLRPRVKVMIGGGPVDETARKYSGADAWGTDAQAAVKLSNKWTEE